MNVYFTSDTHFGHLNIIKYCNRPFASVEEMDETLVRNWNETVGHEDIVVHLGDLTLANRLPNHPRLFDAIRVLKGHKVLIGGNHDGNKLRQTLKELGWLVLPELNPLSNVKMMHYPPVIAEEGVVYIHGHSHGTVTRKGCVDVGVDVVGFRPIPCSQVAELCSVHVAVDGLLLKQSILKFVADAKCALTVPDTFIACGEGEKQERFYCSGLCLEADK